MAKLVFSTQGCLSQEVTEINNRSLYHRSMGFRNNPTLTYTNYRPSEVYICTFLLGGKKKRCNKQTTVARITENLCDALEKIQKGQ